jgi:CRISPR/Cas system-associated exonuclease Cas4 (RecB family)
MLQPLLYALAAERLLDQPVASGHLFFCTQRGGYLHIDVPVNDESRERLTRVLRTIDSFIEQGFLPAAPQAGACSTCDYSPVCGPYEEQRVQRKPADRLAPLVELRGMP